jgi:site-specific DNA recombinase
MQQKGVSIDNQINQGVIFAKTNGMEYSVYNDTGYSGKNIKRPEFIRLINDLKQGDILFVTTQCRLSRNVEDMYNIKKEMKRRKCKLAIGEMGGILEENISNDVMLGIKSIMSEYERKMISHRVSSAMNFKSSMGTLKKKPKFGWKSPGYGLPNVEDEYEQTIIKRMRELRSTLPVFSITNMCKKLEEEGYNSRRAHRWYHNTVKQIMLDNDIPL